MMMTKLNFVAAGLVGASMAAAGAGALMARPAQFEGNPAAPAAPAPPPAAPLAVEAPDARAATARRPLASATKDSRTAPHPAPTPRTSRATAATSEVVAAITLFRTKQVEAELEAGASEVRVDEEEIRKAEQEIATRRQALEEKRAGLRMLESLRGDLTGCPRDRDAAEDVPVEVDVKVARHRPDARGPTRCHRPDGRAPRPQPPPTRPSPGNLSRCRASPTGSPPASGSSTG